jgi:hypothetical protein
MGHIRMLHVAEARCGGNQLIGYGTSGLLLSHVDGWWNNTSPSRGCHLFVLTARQLYITEQKDSCELHNSKIKNPCFAVHHIKNVCAWLIPSAISDTYFFVFPAALAGRENRTRRANVAY